MARICLILDICDRRDLAIFFVPARALDSSLPLSQKDLDKVIGQSGDERFVQSFITEQFRALPPRWNKGSHIKFESEDPLPLKVLGNLGSGSQGVVDKVELIGSYICARKIWRGVSKEIRDQFFKEINLLKRLNPHQHHVVEIFATYTRGRGLGMLMLPVADRDLWSILEESEPQRRTFIADEDPRKTLECLCMGLTHIHQLQIRHQDIKPQNILLRNGRFFYTDFSLSKDVSGLTDSVTEGIYPGTPKYRAPEVNSWEPRGRAADVFSLGCVLMEVWSVLNGYGCDKHDDRSFSSLSPFSQNIPAVMDWIGGQKKDARERRKMKVILRSLTLGVPDSREVIQREFFCSNCLLLTNTIRGTQIDPEAVEPGVVGGWSAYCTQAGESSVENYVEEMVPSVGVESQDMKDIGEDLNGKHEEPNAVEEDGTNETLTEKLSIMVGKLWGKAYGFTTFIPTQEIIRCFAQ
ncbi:kinase-like protein [Glonium stellatum]|uniref:Kinase-like protein n=1 Tax=Glonium stellatum TaxID=574774 RepID=A0A8E2EML3_9PEZI|nr:kinase-like protein [Glonium stellatum]